MRPSSALFPCLRAGLVVIAASAAAIGCASTPAPCPAPVPCPACEAMPAEEASPVPITTDLRAESPLLDRRRVITLEAFSADGALAVLAVDDAARGRGFELVELGTSRTKQVFQTMALGEREARVKALKALGRTPVTAWSNLLPARTGRLFFSEGVGGFVLFYGAGAAAAPLALLPRHGSPEPASASAVTVAVAPGGGHAIVIYRQSTTDSPSLVSDRWFSVPIAFRETP